MKKRVVFILVHTHQWRRSFKFQTINLIYKDINEKVYPGKPLGGALKRAFDVILSSVMLVMAMPVIAIIAVGIRLQDGGPAFYAHQRLGYNRRPFNCLKLRTMTVGGEIVLQHYLSANPAAQAEWELTQKLKNDPRVTPLGRFLRKTSLDELPQLINVLRGDMSIVGPRPITAAELIHYGTSGRHYCSTRPGLTGLWQVSGRNDVGFSRRVALDTFYVRRWKLSRDFAILSRTPAAVVRMRGSY